MAYRSPLGKYLGSRKKEEQITNIYDDGELWSKPEDVTPLETMGYQSPLRKLYGNRELGNYDGGAIDNTIEDPLQAPRNQMNYYTRQLDKLGESPVKPTVKENETKGIFDLLNRIGAVPGAVSNFFAGATNHALKELGNSKASDFLDPSYAESVVGEAMIEGLKSAYHTSTGLFTGEYSDKAVDWGRALDENRDNPNKVISGVVKGVEAPGYLISKHIFGAEEEKAKAWGNIVADLGISLAEGKFTDIDGAGKAIKYLTQNDEMKKIANIADINKATKLADKYNTFDDYVQTLGKSASKYGADELQSMFKKSKKNYAQDIVKDVKKGLGGMATFDGLKIGQKTISLDTLDRIASNDLQRRLATVGLSLYSPVGALINNPVTAKIGDKINSTEIGGAINKTLRKGFNGGKDNEWINAMKDNPEKALEYANERKQKSIQRTLSEDRITKTMNTIDKYSNLKETPEELTRIIEEPTTRKVIEQEVEETVNNPEYIKKIFELPNKEYKEQEQKLRGAISLLEKQKKELQGIADTGKENVNKIEAINSQITNLTKRVDKIKEVKRKSTLDFNKQMKQFGFEGDYTEHFNKALTTDIDELSKEFGNRELAEAMQESANRVLDVLDKKYPGLSKYYTGYGQIDLSKTLTGEVKHMMSPEEYAKYSKGNYDKNIKTIMGKIRETNDPETITKLKAEMGRQYRFKAHKMAREITGGKISQENLKYIDSLQLDEARKFTEMLDNKKKAIKAIEKKPTELTELREYLGTEPTNLKKDIIDLSKKRVEIVNRKSIGEMTPSIKTRNAAKHISIESAKTEDVIVENVMNNLSDNDLKKVATKIAYELEPENMVGVYKNNIDKTYKNTIKKLKGYMYHEVDNSLMKEEALEVAKEFSNESGFDIPYRAIAKLLEGQDYDGAVEKLINISKENKSRIADKYLDNARKLTNSEIELLLGYDSNFKLAPNDIIKEFKELKDGSVIETTRKGTKANKNWLKEAELLSEVEAKDNNIIFGDEGKNISVTGQNRDNWFDDLEAERNKKDTGYDGTNIKELMTDESLIGDKAKATKKRVELINAKNNIKKEKLNDLEEIYQEGLKKSKSSPLGKVAIDSDKDIAKNIKPPVEPVKGIKLSELKNTPISKILEKNVPPKFKGMEGISLSTPQGDLFIDKDIKMMDLDKLINPKSYKGGEVGSKVIYTNKEIGNAIGYYFKKTDTIAINLNNLDRKTAKTILKHEFGHRIVNKLYKEIPDFDVSKYGEDFIKEFKNLSNKDKEKLIDIVKRTSEANAPTKEMVDMGLISRYLNSVVKNNPKGKDIFSNEMIAELNSLYSNTNKSIAKDFRELNKVAYEKFNRIIDSLPEEKLKETLEVTRKRFGEDYANKIVKLKEERKALGDISGLMKKAMEINKTNISIDDIKDNLKKLEKSMDISIYDNEGNFIKNDYDKFFNEMKTKYPKEVEKIDREIPRWKKVMTLQEKILEIDNTSELSNEAKEFISEYKTLMMDIAKREGLENIREDYVEHMINPLYRDEAEIVERGKKLLAELKDKDNMNAKMRTKNGTIKELNDLEENSIGKRIFEENIYRIMFHRLTESEKLITKNNMNKRIVKEFGIPIIKDFNKKVNSESFIREVLPKIDSSYANETLENIIGEYKASGLSSYDFFKDKFGAKQALIFSPNGYAKELLSEYGSKADPNINMLDRIPLKSEDGRDMVRIKDFKKYTGDRTKELPYTILGEESEAIKQNYIKAYNEFIYKESKNRNMVKIQLPKSEKEQFEKVIKRVIEITDEENVIADRTKLSEKISEAIKGDKEALEGFDALAGYTVIDPKKVSLEEFMVATDREEILIDKNAWDNYQKFIKDSEYKEKNGLLKVYDYFTNIFKSQAIFSTGFHIRNGVQNVMASYIKTGANLLDPKKNKEAIDLLLHRSGKKNLTKKFGGYNADELLRELRINGIFETQLKNEFNKEGAKKFLEGKTDKLVKKKSPLYKMLNPLSREFKGYDLSMKAGDLIETQAKLVNVLTHLDNGFTLSDAIEMTKETLFDYSDLTQFESSTMKRLFPFYTFMRKNIPSQLDNLSNHSAKVNRIQGLYRKSIEKNTSKKEQALRPEYLDGQLALGDGRYLNIGNPIVDFAEQMTGKGMLSSVNPILKTPLELATNTNFFREADISKYDKLDEKTKFALESMLPIVRQIRAIYDLNYGTEEEKEKARKTLGKTVGNVTNKFDIKKQEQISMYDYVEELQNQYYEYLDKNPEAKAYLESLNKKKQTKNPGYKSPLGKLIKNKRNGR